MLGEARAQSAAKILAAGPPQSNLCVLTAAACARAGLDCELVINGAEPERKEGNLLLEQPAGRRIAFPSGNQTVYVNPYTILYAQSRDKRTELVCVDRVVSCNYIYRELKERLPEVFYPLRRGYLVNTLYIVALRRFEAELISGISIPIPALTYTQVKRDLQELIEKK